jgi:hypothetical protein
MCPRRRSPRLPLQGCRPHEQGEEQQQDRVNRCACDDRDQRYRSPHRHEEGRRWQGCQSNSNDSA